MIEQFYAVNKKTSEIFSHKGRYCFSEKGVVASIRNAFGVWVYNSKRLDDFSMKLVEDPIDNWEIKKVELK